MAAADIEHLHQLAVHAYYVGEREVGLRACERLLGEAITPEREAIVRRNRTWYTPLLSDLVACGQQRIEIEPAHPGWTLFNPTCLRIHDRVDVIVRSSNYRIVDGRYITPPEDGNVIRTENLLVWYGAAGEQHGPIKIAPDYQASGFPVHGLEDCRLNYVQGRTCVSATIRDHAGTNGDAMIGCGRLFASSIDEISVPPPPRTGRHEKNWAPILGRNEWLYSCHEGGSVITASLGDDGWVLTPRGTSPAISRGFRGGSQLIPVVGGWLCVVHEVADDDGRRIYEHRFVWFDDELTLTHVSQPFAFREQRAIEFCAGLCSDGTEVIATFGVRDSEAWMARVPLRDLDALRRAV